MTGVFHLIAEIVMDRITFCHEIYRLAVEIAYAQELSFGTGGHVPRGFAGPIYLTELAMEGPLTPAI
jgi:hypothetical protein